MKNGRFDNEPEEKYHAEKEYVGSSSLPSIDISPAHFYEQFKNGVEKTDPMETGTFIHKTLLEQDIAKYVARPLKDDGDLVRSNSKEYAEFLAKNAGKTPIKPDLFNGAMDILSAALKNTKYTKSFEECDKEVSFYAEDEETGLLIKARTDMLAKDLSYIQDLKSTSDILGFNKQIFTMSYDVRLVHYAEVIKRVTGVEIDDLRFIVIESKAPYGSMNFKLTPEQVFTARNKWRQMINMIAACSNDNNWPAFSDEWQAPVLPKFLETSNDINFSVGF